MLLGPLWQSCHAWITCRRICRVVIVVTDQVTRETKLHVKLPLMHHMTHAMNGHM